MSKKQKLSIYLLRKNISPKTSLKENTKLKKYNKKGWLITTRQTSHIPDWVEYLSINIKKISSASAVLFIPHEKRYFAICFGYGHNLLNMDKLVDDFGMITGLNALDKNKIKSSDIFAPSDHSKQRRTQTVLDSSLQGHDIDSFSHILKKITGKTRDEYKELFSNISITSKSLKIDTDKTVEELSVLCSKVLTLYTKEDYKKDFSEIFYIRPVKDLGVEKYIYKSLLENLKNKKENIYLDIPDLIDFQDIDEYQLNIKDRKQHIFSELNITEFYNRIPKEKITLENLIKWRLTLLDQNGNKKIEFSLLKCLVFDCKYNKKYYHFSHGKWYCLDSNFSKELKTIEKNKRNKINKKALLKYDHQHEEEYNEKLAKHLKGHCLDKQCIPMGGYDKIEPCDVLCIPGDKNIFIHVKIKHSGSSGLAHLFAQGDISLTLLNNKNEKFTNGIKEKIPHFDEEKSKIIHYLIISNRKDSDLPLFAKVCLFKKIKEIESKGAKVYWSIVHKK